MKIETMFLIILALQINIMLFGAGATHDTPILGFIQNPTNWNNLTFIAVLGIAIGVALIGGSYAGSLIMGRTEIAVFAPLALVFISWAIPLVSLWQLIYEEVELFGPETWLIASIFTFPIGILAFFAVLNWWGNRR